MGVEPTGDGVTRRPPVLKTGTITGPHALPRLQSTSYSNARPQAQRRDAGEDYRDRVDHQLFEGPVVSVGPTQSDYLFNSAVSVSAHVVEGVA